MLLSGSVLSASAAFAQTTVTAQSPVAVRRMTTDPPSARFQLRFQLPDGSGAGLEQALTTYLNQQSTYRVTPDRASPSMHETISALRVETQDGYLVATLNISDPSATKGKVVLKNSKEFQFSTSEISYDFTEEKPEIPVERPQLQVGLGEGNVVLQGGGTYSFPIQDGKAIRQIAGEFFLPLNMPGDLKGVPSAKRPASKEVPDSLRLEYRQLRYKKGGTLTGVGLRARSNSNFSGNELVGYWSPLFFFNEEGRQAAAIEVEAGWRDGNAEWTNQTTQAPARGSLVSRIGALYEWTPRVEPIGINRNLSHGMRFFIRARGWADYAKNDEGTRRVRLRNYIDSELFYKFTESRRIFLRYETGALPPDLTRRVSRLSIGVGAAF